MNSKILIIDISYLTQDLKSMTPTELETTLKDKYKTDVFLIDSSKMNLQGSKTSNIQSPVYFTDTYDKTL